MLKKIIITVVIVVATLYTIWLCSADLIGFINKAMLNGDYRITNLNIYYDTPAWDLAKAVKTQNVNKIKKIIHNNSELLNYQDPKYGATLLYWSIGMEKYKSAKALLECGADPNIPEPINGETPLFLAAGFSWIDNYAKKDAKYVKLLLSYGADPNINYIGSDSTVIEPGRSPLMNSIGCGIEKTKALVEAGADINYKTAKGNTVAIKSLYFQGNLEYAYYIIVQMKAEVSEPYYRRKNYRGDNPNDEFYPVELLRDWIYDLDTKEYEMKMEIVEEFARQGVNYRESNITDHTLNRIKALYPDTWEEYINKY